MNTITDRLTSHLGTVSPGLPCMFPGAHSLGAIVAQGDVYLRLAKTSNPPKEYVEVQNPTEADRQIAVEVGVGSHHRIKTLDGVRIFRPRDWGKDETDLRGPFLVFSAPNEIVHEPGHDRPHGTVVIDAPCAIEVGYQKNLDAITRAEIRARD